MQQLHSIFKSDYQMRWPEVRGIKLLTFVLERDKRIRFLNGSIHMIPTSSDAQRNRSIYRRSKLTSRINPSGRISSELRSYRKIEYAKKIGSRKQVEKEKNVAVANLRHTFQPWKRTSSAILIWRKMTTR